MRLVTVTVTVSTVSALAACAPTIAPIQDAPDGGPKVVVDAAAPPPPMGLLASLSLSPGPLTPAFSANVYDYTVQCAAGTNNVSVTMQTTAGAVASLLSPLVSQAAETQSVSLSIEEDAAIVVNVASGDGQSVQYWVRCLPHDFPPITVTPHPSVATATPGYYLTGNGVVGQGNGGFAMILDTNGTPVWYRRVTGGAFNLELIDDDVVAFIPTLGPFGDNPTAQYEIDVLNPWQTETVEAVGSPTDEHELTMMPNGDRLVFSYPLVSGVDLTGLGDLGPDATVADCEIQEIDANNNLVWSWHGLDHIDPIFESTDQDPTQLAGVTVIDPIHCNSIALDTDGNLMVSARNLDAVFLIDKTTSLITWKMGGTGYSKDSAQEVTIENDPLQAFHHQHDARFVPDGTISLFDDQTNQPASARGVIYAIDLGASTATFLWQANGTGNTVAMGSFRTYADGSRVVGWGISMGPSSPVFSEVDANGVSILDVSLGAGNWAYRTVKVTLDELDIDLLRATTANP